MRKDYGGMRMRRFRLLKLKMDWGRYYYQLGPKGQIEKTRWVWEVNPECNERNEASPIGTNTPM